MSLLRSVFLVIALTGVFFSCATTEQFVRLELGMSKAEVTKTVGEPELARGAIQNKFGQLIEVWEYYRFISNWSPDKKRMWVYFSDGKLVQWGQAGDWEREADRIYEFRFR